MSDEKLARLREIIGDRPSLSTVVDAILEAWPSHLSYLLKSLGVRSATVLDATEVAASAALKLAADRLPKFAQDYIWTCNNFREEEMYFFREGRYRLSKFEEAMARVYSNSEYMEQYMNGLLICSVAFANHAQVFEMYLNRVIGALDEGFDYLEIGPGNGLKISIAAQSPYVRSLEAWDVSDVSLRDTRAALEKLQVTTPVKFSLMDILAATLPEKRYNLIVISEVLEHLERPDAALASLRSMISDGGRLFITVPLNSPAPDHIYLLSEPNEVRELVEAEGFRVESLELYATQGEPIDRALDDKISISAGVVARPN